MAGRGQPEGDVAGADLSTVVPQSGSELSTVSPGHPDYVAPASTSPSVTGSRFGDFQILTKLGQGGMGSVFKARDRLGRMVALKVILSAGYPDEESIRRFELEARAAASLDHTGIVQVFEAGQFAGQHYISYAFVDGQTLRHRIKDAPLEPRMAATLLKQAADAMQYAHDHKIIHRDLKPENILLTLDGQARVADFGLAKSMSGESIGLDTNLTRGGQIFGTPAYMPPEQARGEMVGPPADLYSLGATLYCVLTGRPPFHSADLFETLRQVRDDEPVSPRVLNPAIDKDLETICLKCLQKEPARRYASAGELSEELGRFLRREPIRARPVGRLERMWRWCRRNPLPAALCAATTMMLIVASVAAIGLQWKTTELQRALARNYFESGIMEYQDGRPREGMERLFKAASLLRASDPQFNGYRRVLADRVTRGGLCPSVPLRHADGVLTVAFSPSGDLVVSGGADKTARLWDVYTGAPRGEAMRHGAAVTAAAFSHRGDYVATGSDDGTAQLWLSDSGAARGEPLRHEGAVRCVAFSPDDRLLAAGSENGVVHVWSFRDSGGPRIAAFRHQGRVSTVAFSPDSSSLVTASDDGTACVWNARTGERVGSPLKSLGPVRFAAISPDGKSIATASVDTTVQLWGSATHEPFGKPVAHKSYAVWVGFSPDGSRLASTGDDGLVQIADAATGAVLGSYAHRTAARGGTFSPDGELLATFSDDRAVRVWDLSADKERELSISHGSEPTCAAFSPDGLRLAVGGRDHLVRLWIVRRAAAIGEPMLHSGPAKPVTFLADGSRILVGRESRPERSWDAATGIAIAPVERVLSREPCSDQRNTAVHSLTEALHGASGRRADGSDEMVQVRETSSGKTLGRGMQHPDFVTELTFSPSGEVLLTGCHDRFARLWDAATGELLRRPMPHSCSVIGVAFGPDGRIATGAGDGTISLWDAADPFAMSLPQADFWAWLELALGVRQGPLSDAEPPPVLPLTEWHDRWISLERRHATLFEDWRNRERELDRLTHRQAAAAAEERGGWFAAEFHLRSLVKGEGADTALGQRHRDAQSRINQN